MWTHFCAKNLTYHACVTLNVLKKFQIDRLWKHNAIKVFQGAKDSYDVMLPGFVTDFIS